MSELRAAHAVLDCETHYVCAVRTGRHKLTADEPPSNGGADTGPSPYDLVLAGLAACTAITLRMYADRKGWPLGRIHVDLELYKDEQTKADRIARTISFGETLDADKKARLAEIAEKTPVTKTLKAGAKIETKLL